MGKKWAKQEKNEKKQAKKTGENRQKWTKNLAKHGEKTDSFATIWFGIDHVIRFTFCNCNKMYSTSNI